MDIIDIIKYEKLSFADTRPIKYVTDSARSHAPGLVYLG